MKGIDEFLMWLLAGLAMLAIFMIFLSSAPIEFGEQKPIEQRPTISHGISNISEGYGELPPLTSPSGAVFVGKREREAWRVIRFEDIKASYHSGEVLKSLGDRKIYNGVLFGSNKLNIEFVIDPNETIGTYLSFFVNKTNNYGALIIKVNNITLTKQRLSVGEYTFYLNKSILQERNNVEIFAESSNWKIWAPTVYELINVKVVAQELFVEKESRNFNIYDDEFASLKKDRLGEIYLDLREHNGKLKIYLNSKEIFVGELPQATKKIYFNQDYLKREKNEIEFIALDGMFKGYAELKFYFTLIDDLKAEKSFEISQYSYSRLHQNPGKISFIIESVVSPGGLAVVLQDARGKESLIAYDIAKEGIYYNYTFYPHQCSPGINKLIIKSVDNAKFYVKDLNVTLE